VSYKTLNLTSEQKALCQKIMAESNCCRKKWDHYHSSFIIFRTKLLEGSTNPDNCIPLHQLKNFQEQLPFILAIRDKKFQELGNRSVEEIVFLGYNKMTFKMSKKSFSNTGFMDKEDYLQEAQMALFNAIWNYQDNQIEFSTFLFKSIKNRIQQIKNQDNPWCPLNINDANLLNRFNAMQNENFGKKFDDIVADLKLTSKEVSNLLALKKSVISCNCRRISSCNYDRNHENGDIFNSIIIKEEETEEENIHDLNYVIKKLLNDPSLTDLDKIVVQNILQNDHGWQAKIAKEHINPETGKPYSRMAINLCLKKIYQKMKFLLKKAA
jgi:DNA-directed RNA polymerase specialized sigma subunit